MYGFQGKILVVDLSRSAFEILHKDEAYYRKVIGGGLLCAALYEELTADRKRFTAFSPENPVIFATGPLAGNRVCGATRVNVMSLAPESSGIYLSQAGGEFGPNLKRAGFDALAVTGMSPKPVILAIDGTSVQFMDAKTLWGMDRMISHGRLMSDLGEGYCIASIGPAGEHLVRHANIMFEPDHYAGRGGLGAVLGSKQVKAIAVKGNQDIVFNDPETVNSLNRKGGLRLSKAIKKSPDSFMGILGRLGTFGLLEINQKAGNLPTRNFNSGSPGDEKAIPELTRKAAETDFVGNKNPCRNCFVACKKRSKSNPEYSALAEYESVALLGPNIGLEKNLETSLAACERCNRLGLDTISTGNLIAWLMECFEKGVITEKDFGFSITFGDGQKTMQLIEDMAFRKTEMGNLLADGIDKAAAKLGPDTKPHHRFVKGIGMPAHLARKKPGVGFGYLHGPNPNDHMKLEHDWIGSDPASLKAFGLDILSEPDALDKNKIEIVRATQIFYSALDAFSLCLFVFIPGNVYTSEEIIEMLNAATGFNFHFDDLMEIGERAIQLQRKLYIHLGGTDEEFLPFLETEIPEGPSKGARIDRNDFYQARKHYYTLMGWDEDGRVLEETLKKFGL